MEVDRVRVVDEDLVPKMGDLAQHCFVLLDLLSA